MATFKDYWYRICYANNEMKNSDKITMSVDSFQRQLEKAYQQGVADQRDLTAKTEALRPKSAFGSIFG